MIIKMIKALLPPPLKRILRRSYDFVTWDPWVNRSWSQEGEDMVLRRVFEGKKSGFYVDVGAHHPKRFSNTFLFYKRGWRGINIDPMPGSMRLFQKWRPRDTNLELGIAETEGSLNYYVFNEPALNGFVESLSIERDKSASTYRIEKTINIGVLPLAAVFSSHLPENQKIDFLTIDVEGLDFQVIKSNDWSKYRPSFVLVEILKSNLDALSDDPISIFMRKIGYEIYAKQMNTVFFRKVHD